MKISIPINFLFILIGKQLFVHVAPTEINLLQVHKNITVYLVNTSGDLLESFHLVQGQRLYNLSYYGLLITPSYAFRLMFIGYSKNGEVIQRVLPHLMTPQEFEINQQILKENSLVIFPGEKSSINVSLDNYGSIQTFNILVYDDKSFVASYEPKVIDLSGNDSVQIQINLLAAANTSNGVTSSITVSATVPGSGSSNDIVNFFVLRVAVFSKVRRNLLTDTLTQISNVHSLLCSLIRS